MYKDRPWLKSYEPHVPECLDYPNTTIPQALAETAHRFPDRTALIYKDKKIT